MVCVSSQIDRLEQKFALLEAENTKLKYDNQQQVTRVSELLDELRNKEAEQRQLEWKLDDCSNSKVHIHAMCISHTAVSRSHSGACTCRCNNRMIEFNRSEEHTSELQSLMRISYAVFCLKKKKKNTQQQE